MTQPITPEVYAFLRAAIDGAAEAVRTWAERRADGCVHFCMPKVDPDLGTLSDLLYAYVPVEAVSIGPAQAMALALQDAENPPLVPEDTIDDRRGWPTFADREQLLAALDKVTPADVRAQLGTLQGPPVEGAEPGTWIGADADGLSWWGVALAAGGVLAWLGRRTVWGLIVSVGARRLLQALVAAGVAYKLAPLALDLIEAAENAAASTFSIVPWAIGGAVVVVLGVTAVAVLRRPAGRRSLSS